MYDYRAGRFGQAIGRLEAAEYRNEPWSKAFLAMAHHGLGKTQEAEEWRTRAQEGYNARLRSRLEQTEPSVGPIWGNPVNELDFYREAQELITGKRMPPNHLQPRV